MFYIYIRLKMERIPLAQHALTLPPGNRMKIMMEYRPTCLCCCYQTDVKLSSWDSKTILKIRRTLRDYCKYLCCDNRVTVSGITEGKIQYPICCGGSSSFLNSNRNNEVESMSINAMTSPVFWTLNMAYAATCSRWSFYTQPASVDFFVANGIDGSEELGIHGEHEYYAVRGCCIRDKRACCMLCCPTSDYKVTTVHGARVAGSPLIGSLSSGSDGGICCPHYGGVADIPESTTPEQIVQWTMLWSETKSNNGYTRLKNNWKNRVNISTIQQMA